MLSGTTATCILIKGDKLYVGNVGDSAAVLGTKSGTEPILLTEAHRAENEEEKSRIKSEGGMVVWYNGKALELFISITLGSWRVNGQMALSRSIGDEPLSCVVAEPYLFETTLTSDHDFIVAASDGLWDVMTDKQVVEFVHNWKADQSKKHLNVSDALAEEAQRLDSQDNLTILVIFLQEHGVGLRKDQLGT